jgi:hypothetical protein
MVSEPTPAHETPEQAENRHYIDVWLLNHYAVHFTAKELAAADPVLLKVYVIGMVYGHAENTLSHDEYVRCLRASQELDAVGQALIDNCLNQDMRQIWQIMLEESDQDQLADIARNIPREQADVIHWDKVAEVLTCE